MPRHQMTFSAASDCEEAQKYMQVLHDDPMTEAMGAPTGDIMDGYLRKHIKACKKCNEATIEANMP